MKKSGWWVGAFVLPFVLSSCGGGGGEAPSAAAVQAANVEPLRSAPPPTSGALFSWAEQTFPQYFAGAGVNGTLAPYSYRYYAQTDTYAAVSTDGGVFVRGPQISNNQIVRVGEIGGLTCQVTPGACPDAQVGVAATGTVASGERDWHKIALLGGQAYAFSLEGTPTGQGTLPDPYLRIFNTTGAQLTWDDDSGTTLNAALVCAPTSNAVYFVSAEGFETDTGTYRLTVTPTTGPAAPCENHPGGFTLDWEGPFSATELASGSLTLAPLESKGWQIATGSTQNMEIMFAAQAAADLYITTAATLDACVAGGSFTPVGGASFDSAFGYRAFTLPAGTYGLCVRNKSSAANTVSAEVQNQPVMAGFRFGQNRFAVVAQTVAPGVRLTQAATAGDDYRTLIDGASTGGTFYIIPSSEVANFMAGVGFQHYPELTAACAPAGPKPPELCELTGVENYSIAYLNDTASPQSIVVVGRDYVPE